MLRKKTITLDGQDDCTGRIARGAYSLSLLDCVRPGQRWRRHASTRNYRELEKYRMFVLKNAWAALGRVKWRTALTALLALLVSASAAV